MKRTLFTSTIAMVGLVVVVGLCVGETAPRGFDVTLLTDQLYKPQGIDAPLQLTGTDALGRYLYIAEGPVGEVCRMDLHTGALDPFGDTLGRFPVGVACPTEGIEAFLFAGNAGGYGVTRIDMDGNCIPYAFEEKYIAGLAFGRGQFGSGLYAAEFRDGEIWRVNIDGGENLFAYVAGCEIWQIAFSPVGYFGHYLYATDRAHGDIYRIDPDGNAELFTSIGSPSLAGLAFGSGEFGQDLYVGDMETGQIFRVHSDGSFEVWANGFIGVADIVFRPRMHSKTMYIVDGYRSLFAITPH